VQTKNPNIFSQMGERECGGHTVLVGRVVILLAQAHKHSVRMCGHLEEMNQRIVTERVAVRGDGHENFFFRHIY
jgi:hypothetical protein